MSGGCRVVFEEVVDYAFGDTAAGAEEAFEEHLFACERCGRRLDVVELLRRSVADAVRGAALGAVVNQAFLDRAAADGLTLLEYCIEEGTSVACSAGPEDLVVVRLAAPFEGVGELRVDGTFHDLERDVETPLPAREVLADRGRGEVVLVFPGEAVRSYPRSRWTLRVRGETAGGTRELGPFVMDHTP